MFPIRCLVETVSDGQCAQCSISGGTVIADSYAIVAGQTPLNQLVDTVLTALGLQNLSYGAKGTLPPQQARQRNHVIRFFTK